MRSVAQSCSCRQEGGDDSTDESRALHQASRRSQPSYFYTGSSAQPGGTASSGAKKGYLVMLALFVYCIMRAVQLALFAGSVLDSSGDINTNMYRFVPALGFMAVQSAMLNKWIDHVSELTLVLQHHSFGIGQYLMTCSVFLMIADGILTLLALIDTQGVHFTNQPGHMWNVLVNMFCGVVYAFNGIAFSGLGLFLRRLWIPITPMGVHASKRILGIALIFGVMCIARGAILLMYIDDDTTANTHVHKVTHNDWGAPAVLLFEWAALVTSLFLLTVAKNHNNNNSSLVIATVPSAVAFSAPSTTTGTVGGAVDDDYGRDGTAPMLTGSSANHYAYTHPRQSVSASEVSLATMDSNPGSARRPHCPPKSTVVTASPFTSSGRPSGGIGGQQSHSRRHNADLQTSALRLSMMRGAPSSAGGVGSISGSSSRRSGGLHATAVAQDPTLDDSDATDTNNVGGIVVTTAPTSTTTTPHSSARADERPHTIVDKHPHQASDTIQGGSQRSLP